MSLARLSAGAGYRYLLRNTATHDVVRAPALALVEYYALSGNPPGRWLGAGLPGLGAGDGRDLVVGTVVTEEAMGRLFGSGHDLVTGGRLGLAYPKFKSATERIAERVARLPDDLPEDERVAAATEIESQENARPQRSAVAGYDLTFTVPKSVSVLWALGDGNVRRAIEKVHHEALDAVLELIQERFLHTRIGEGSKIRVQARGGIAAAFDHYDTRAGDPNLHTHLVIANKVQGPDGRWRAVDGQVLYNAAVALSEIYDCAVADLLAQRLSVTFAYRDRGPRRTPAYEIDGIPDPLLATFSSRSEAIGTYMQDLVATFTDAHGREPNRVEVLRLRQQATLATRPDKHVASLAELRARWRATAETVTGQPVDSLVREALTSANTGLASISATAEAPSAARAIPEALLHRYAETTVAAIAERRATWTAANVLAEAARATRALRLPTFEARMTLLDAVAAASLGLCVLLDPPVAAIAPNRYTHRELVGASMEAPEPVYSTWTILAAEARLLAAHHEASALTADPGPIRTFLGTRRAPGTARLSAEQARAAEAIATSGRRLDVLVGPAGAGKTRALCVLRATWEQSHGTGSVIGLAPSAVAAAELAASLGIPTETLAKWAHQSDPNTAGGQPWQLRPTQLVIVDEAAMSSTAHLDQLVTQATAAGAKVLLVGDPCQLGAVDAGGAFSLLIDEGHAVELEQLHRFTEPWEADATRLLRRGDPSALALYASHARISDGPAEAMAEVAYRAWAADIQRGADAVLLAGTREAVSALNRRARVDRIRDGVVATTTEAALHDGTHTGPGDIVVTRRNDRRLIDTEGEHVRNGDRWHVAAVHEDGSVDVRRLGAAPLPPQHSTAVHLPAEYVRRHVELGYACTIHRAQGSTADTAHLVADPAMSREALYVAMTRGRHTNHVYVPTDTMSDTGHGPADGSATQTTASQILERCLRTEDAEMSATATLRARLHRFSGAVASGRSPSPSRPRRHLVAPPSGRPDPPDLVR